MKYERKGGKWKVDGCGTRGGGKVRMEDDGGWGVCGGSKTRKTRVVGLC